MRKSVFAIWALALVISPTAAVFAETVPGTVQAVPSPAALALARTIASEANVLQQLAYVLHDQTPKALAANPQFQALEKRWPGISAEFIAALEPIITRYTRDRLPTYQGQVAALFAARMSAEEINATTTFYRSPAGQHVIAMMLRGADYTALLQQQIASGGEAPVKGEDIRDAVQQGVATAMTKLSPEDLKALITFGLSPAGRKMNEINPDLQALAAANANRQDEAMEKEIEVTSTAIAMRHLAAEKAK